MKTALFSSSYLDGTDWQGSNRLLRTERYLNYYAKIKEKIGFDHIFLADNGSQPSQVRKLGIHAVHGGTWEQLEKPSLFPATVIWYPEKYSKDEGCNYPYVWRALYAIRDLIERLGYDKIIYCETDAFIVSEKLAEHTRSLSSGWTCHKLARYKFPAAEFNVLCKDSFKRYLDFTAVPFMEHNGRLYESALPFSQVLSEFDCDRYGESLSPQSPSMDLYSQCPLEVDIEFNLPSVRRLLLWQHPIPGDKAP